MTLEVKHLFQSAKGDGPDTTLVQPSDWNALHVLTAEPALIGNPGVAGGPVVEIPLGPGLQFTDGALENTVKGVPIGAVIPFAGGFAPPYWLMCFGQEVDRTIFATLFSVIGTTYGVGNGSTTFNVPDLRGRVAAGKDNMGGSNANRIATTVDGKVLGNVVGTEKHILAVSHLPAHSHTGTAASAGTHRHLTATEGDASTNDPTLEDDEFIVTKNSNNLSYRLNGTTAAANAGRTTDAGSHTHTLTINNTGSGEGHLNMQPSIILNYIIWAGAQAP